MAACHSAVDDHVTAADQSLLLHGYVVRHTFIDVAPTVQDAPQGARPRSKSCGDQPSNTGDLLLPIFAKQDSKGTARPKLCLPEPREGSAALSLPAYQEAKAAHAAMQPALELVWQSETPSVLSTAWASEALSTSSDCASSELGASTDDATPMTDFSVRAAASPALSPTTPLQLPVHHAPFLPPQRQGGCSPVFSPFHLQSPFQLQSPLSLAELIEDAPLWAQQQKQQQQQQQQQQQPQQPPQQWQLPLAPQQQQQQPPPPPPLLLPPQQQMVLPQQVPQQLPPQQQQQEQQQHRQKLAPQPSMVSQSRPRLQPQAQGSRRRRACTADPSLDCTLAFDTANNAHEVLELMQCPTVNLADVVSALHMIAKFVDAGALGLNGACGSSSPHQEPGVGSGGGLQMLLRDSRFLSLIKRLEAKAPNLDAPRSIMRTVWALGKVGARGSSVEAVVAQVARAVPPLLPQFSTQEMSNTLWGLARLASVSNGGLSARSPAVSQLTLAIIAESRTRLSEFSAQCLTNSVWAIAKLELDHHVAGSFAQACLQQIRRNEFSDVSPQGMANSLWAAAKLRLGGQAAVGFCVEAASRAVAAPGLLALFQPQELSMALWAVARIIGRGTPGSRGRGGLPKEVEAFATSVAGEGFRRLTEFGPQGLSNIAWALATMDLVRHEAPRRFILAAAQMSAPGLRDYPPQAIANFCWAMGRLGRAKDALAAFGAAAAHEATERSSEFSWQDLSGIVSAMMHVDLTKVSQVRKFAVSLVHRTAHCCHDIGTQALLNIALAAVRLGVDRQDLTPMAWGIEEAFTYRMAQLNDIDMRQWLEVQRYCGLPSAGAAAAAGGGRAGHHFGGECSRRGGAYRR